jgi:NAD(P)-dependent dehydrogenase (short-subunit alcohol dehydrogenase family)
MDVNVKGIFKMTQAALPLLRANKGTVVNIVSNAAHMPMRCSAAYNASKGAALILTKQLARELSPDVTVFSVSPNRLADTGMSRSIDEQVLKTRGWTLEQAQQYQRASLLSGDETPPEAVAEFIAFLLATKERHRYLAGCDIPYGA